MSTISRLRTAPTSPRRLVSLVAIDFVVGLSAVPSGILLMRNGLGMSERVLRHSPFDSFVIPGLILSVVGGGTSLAAVLLIWRRAPTASLVSLGAGCILLGWIVVEAVMVREGRALQATILAMPVLSIVLAWGRIQSGRAAQEGAP